MIFSQFPIKIPENSVQLKKNLDIQRF